LEQYAQRVTCWKNSGQGQRRVAAALLEIEPDLREIKGCQHLHKLRLAMKSHDDEQVLVNAA